MRTPLALGRRALLAASVAASLPIADARADAERQRIQIGATVFDVPKPYLFDEFTPLGTTTDGLPPRFSFAFTAPDGKPAGQNLEFPPMTHPFVLERPGNQFLVMCYRVAETGPGKLHVRPREQLANSLSPTELHEYSTVDGSLSIELTNNKDVRQRYYSVVNLEDKMVIEAFLLNAGDSQFFFGGVEFGRLQVGAIIYIPATRHSDIQAALLQAGKILLGWTVS